jgi:uncharacterized membrane protein YbhN (UPF0104 family)
VGLQQTAKRLLKYLPPVLGLLVLAGIIAGLHHELRRIGLHDVTAALAATPRRQIVHALECLDGSLLVMCAYDVPGVLFARRLEGAKPLAWRRVALASFCAYALSHVVGAPALSAAAIRLRLYTQWGITPSGAARIMALSASQFTLGFLSLLGGILVLAPHAFPGLGHTVPIFVLRTAGAVLWLAVAGYGLAARAKAVLPLGGKRLELPPPGLALLQIFLGWSDLLLASAIFYAVLPFAPGLSYPHVLTLYMAAFLGGLWSGLPGGAGVFDSVLLLGLTGYVPPAQAIGAILLFRVLYFIAPACLAAVCYAVHEVACHFLRKPTK